MNPLSEIIGVLVILMGAAGYLFNIVAVFSLPAIASWTGFDVMRVVGVFVPPLGAVIGYF